MSVDGSLPDGTPEPARLLGRCVAAGLPTPGCRLLLDTSSADDLALVARLGPLPPGLLDLAALGPARPVVVPGLPVHDIRVLAAGLRAAASIGGPVLVQPQVLSVHAGRAALRTAAAVDVVLAVEGGAHDVDTAAEVRRLEMPVLTGRWQRAHRGGDEWRTPLPPWGMRLSRLLRDVRRVLPGLDLDVEWADDGRVCHLLRLARPAL